MPDLKKILILLSCVNLSTSYYARPPSFRKETVDSSGGARPPTFNQEIARSSGGAWPPSTHQETVDSSGGARPPSTHQAATGAAASRIFVRILSHQRLLDYCARTNIRPGFYDGALGRAARTYRPVVVGWTEVLEGGHSWLTLQRPASQSSGRLHLPGGTLLAVCQPLRSEHLPAGLLSKDGEVRETNDKINLQVLLPILLPLSAGNLLKK